MALTRLSGAAALLGGLLCSILTPIQAYIWDGADAAPLVLAFGPLLAAAEAFHAQAGPLVNLSKYHFYGRMFCLVYLLAMAGLWGIHERQRGYGRRWEVLAFRVLLGALLVGFVSDLLAYWGGSDPEQFSAVQALGFTTELLALLVVLIGTVFYGVATLGAQGMSRSIPLLMILAGPAGVAMVAVIRYVPHAALLPFCLVMAGAGFVLLYDGQEPRRS